MLMPKRTKYRRPHRVSYEGKAKGAKTLNFGEYGLMSLGGAWITSANRSRQNRDDPLHETRRNRLHPHLPPHGKNKETFGSRMGGGKGSPEGFVAVVKKGTIVFEIGGVDEETARSPASCIS